MIQTNDSVTMDDTCSQNLDWSLFEERGRAGLRTFRGFGWSQLWLHRCRGGRLKPTLFFVADPPHPKSKLSMMYCCFGSFCLDSQFFLSPISGGRPSGVSLGQGIDGSVNGHKASQLRKRTENPRNIMIGWLVGLVGRLVGCLICLLVGY